MRLISLPVGSDLLEIHINFWKNREEVYFNGQLASSRQHFLGTTHHFTTDAVYGIGVDRYRVVTGYGWMGFAYDVFKNDKCLLASHRTKITAPKTGHRNNVAKKEVTHVSRMGDPLPPDRELLEDLLV